MVQTVRSAAQRRQGDCLALLDLLRRLERLHYDIRDTLFCDALPDNRQRLYRLLRDIEQEGGWPYIKRMQLLSLVDKLEKAEQASGYAETEPDE
ncbi:MAG: hypothetical protein AAF716_01495 [Cyanobacteria bacterium P01_D01_bin.1]